MDPMRTQGLSCQGEILTRPPPGCEVVISLWNEAVWGLIQGNDNPPDLLPGRSPVLMETSIRVPRIWPIWSWADPVPEHESGVGIIYGSTGH